MNLTEKRKEINKNEYEKIYCKRINHLGYFLCFPYHSLRIIHEIFWISSTN